jgi:hypothetical protein
VARDGRAGAGCAAGPGAAAAARPPVPLQAAHACTAGAPVGSWRSPPSAVCFCLERGARGQVSHHPPIAAAHAENAAWVYDIVSAPTTKFLGNSVDIYPVGAPALPGIGYRL